MRIVHIVESLEPERGGPPAVAARLAAAQARLGHKVSLVSYTPIKGRETEVNSAYNSIPGLDKVRMEHLPPESGPWYWVALIGRHRLRELLPSVDVVHLHGVWEPLLRIAAAIARRLKVPYVVRPCGMLDPWSLSQKPLKKRLALRFFYRRMLDRAAFLHVLNVDEKRLIEPLGLRCPAAVIPNGMFLEEVDPLPTPGTFRKTQPKLGDAPYVLFLSRLHFKKGLDYLADAFARVAREIPDVRLVVAGPDGGARQDFEKRVAAHGIADRVDLVGPLYGASKIAAMVDAACFCLPSRQEGFSVAITEALACQVPVVISDACHFPDVAAVNAGFVVELDAQSVADGIMKVLRDPEASRQMGRAGRELVASRYTWPQIARVTVERYQQLSDRWRLAAESGKAETRMRVLHVISSLDPEHGGPPMTAFRLAVAQAKRGAQVTLAHYEETPEAQRRIREASAALPISAEVTLQALPRGGRIERVTAHRAKRALEPLIRDADIVHLHTVWDPIVVAAAAVARRLRKPYVLCPHGMLDPWSLSQKSVKKKIALLLRYRGMLDAASFLHVLNRDEKDLIAPLGLRCPFEVIPNGVFLAEIDLPAAAAVAAAANANDPGAAVDGKPFVLFLSRLHYKKGLDCLANAFAKVAAKAPDLRLVVAGPDGGEQERFVSRVQALGITDVVHVVGPVYGVSKYALIKKASCFCLPSRQEGFSIAILEALACAVPVVISENCHFPEVAEEGAGIITPLDAAPIADGLLTVAGDPEMRARMGEAGRRLVVERFTWEKVAEGSLDAYDRATHAANLARLRRIQAVRRAMVRAAAAVLAVLLLTELVARLGFGLCDPPLLRADANMEYIFRASQHCRQFGNTIDFNSYSMRADDFPRVKSSPDEFRVLVLGDSIVFGGTKVDQGDLATSRLQAALRNRLNRPVIIGNVGCASWGPQNVLAYVKTYGFFDADVVVVVTSSHDVADVMTFAPIVDRDPSFPSEKPRLALWEIGTRYLPRFFAIQRESLSAATPAQGSTSAPPPPEKDVAASMQALDELLASARASGARVILAQHSEQSELDGKSMYGHDVILSHAQASGVEVVQLAPGLRAARDRGEQPYRDFIHLSPLGQEILAQVLEEAILSKSTPGTAPTR